MNYFNVQIRKYGQEIQAHLNGNRIESRRKSNGFSTAIWELDKNPDFFVNSDLDYRALYHVYESPNKQLIYQGDTVYYFDYQMNKIIEMVCSTVIDEEDYWSPCFIDKVDLMKYIGTNQIELDKVL